MPYIHLGSTINTDSLSYNDVLQAYSRGYFPLGEEDGSIVWVTHLPRAIIPVGKKDLKLSRSLRQVINKGMYEIKTDSDFYGVINNCALFHKPTWITGEIKRLYLELYNKGFAHSVEAYSEGKLAGGLYGVAYRSAFFGESMFTSESNASKVCCAALYDILAKNGFKLFDVQMITSLTKQFGAVEISGGEYKKKLAIAMQHTAEFKFI
ncbi:MAG: leucyl/phenylalanyl-tRNA--protein transferase [Ignavibacteria bacterium]|nr:leucyl/phenylalanyl-tRNA--protein transferase [Ignavibacteria bacterium]